MHGALPVELVEAVLQELFYDDLCRPDYTTLSACSNVCSLWRDPAQKLLFHQLNLPGRHREEHLAAFRAAVYGSSERCKLLASHVRRVHIVLGSGGDAEANEASDLVELLSNCHQVYEVTLVVSKLHELDACTMEALHDAHRQSYPTPVRALGLLSCGVMSPIPYQLLSVWSAIQYLRVGTEIAAPPPRTPSKVRLYELVLWRLPRPPIIAWLLSSSQETLRVLGLISAPTDHYDHVLQAHYEHLQSLRFFQYTQRSGGLARRFTNLREFVVTHLSGFLPLGRLPQSLEHLSFRYLSEAMTGIVLESIIVAVDKLPKLRLISCDAATAERDQFGSLEKLCGECGVNISFDVLPIRMSEDPVPLSSYPRGRSVENFWHMNQGISSAQ
ncbi:hypothetical protein BC835DRAFT_1411117 [Cytidiella melzeri]|nr:hypothetical protein BC835DRAFT_1411117 [Cytidiella melzeri]